MAISDTITSMYENVGEVYDTITNVTLPEHKNIENIPRTIRDSYLQIMNNGIDVIYDNWEKVTGSGESLSLTPTEEAKMGIIYKGNTSQETTTGSNYFDSSFSNTTYYNVNFAYDSGIITLNNTSSSSSTHTYLNNSLNNILEAGTYTLIFQYIGGTISTNSMRLSIGNSSMVTTTDDSNRYFSFVIPNSNTSSIVQTKTFTENKTINKWGFFINPNTPFNNFKFRVYIVEGTYTSSNFPEYEPYTGGKPSPNPDYPQEIQVVSGDNTIKVEGKNKVVPFSYTRTHNGITFTYSTNGSINLNGTSTGTAFSIANEDVSIYTKLKAGTYTLSGGTNDILLRFDNTTGTNIAYTTSSTQFTLNEDTDGYIQLRITSGKTFNNVKVYPMINEGSTALPYEPYQSASYPINLPVENLFNVNDIFDTNINASGVESASDITKSSNYIEALPNTTYTNSFYFNYTTATLRYHLYDANKNWIKQVAVYYTLATSNIQKVTFTTTEDTKYIRFTLRHGTEESKNEYDIQLEVGTKANSYTPYGTTPIELCKIGTYQDRIFKSSGKNLFDIGTNSTEDYYNNYISSINENSIILNGAGGASSRFVRYQNYKGNDTYTISLNNSKTSANNRGLIRVRKLDDSGWITSNLGISGLTYNSTYGGWYFTMSTNENKATQTITIPECLYWQFGYINIYNESVTIYNIQIEKGITATPYEPYGTSWYLNKQIGKVVLDGSEDLYTGSGTTQVMYHGALGYIHDTTKLPCNISTNCQMPNNNLYFYDTGLTLEQFKTLLNTTNAIVYGRLSTPTYTPVEGTLKEQLEAIKTSYEGQTNISQTNDDLPFNLDVSALKKV